MYVELIREMEFSQSLYARRIRFRGLYVFDSYHLASRDSNLEYLNLLGSYYRLFLLFVIIKSSPGVCVMVDRIKFGRCSVSTVLDLMLATLQLSLRYCTRSIMFALINPYIINIDKTATFHEVHHENYYQKATALI